LKSNSQDIVFSACVFHHIPHQDHGYWLEELKRVTRAGGILVIYEHNPFNPITLKAVKLCKLDINARLISPSKMSLSILDSGWTYAKRDYKLFFPAFASALRRYEKYLSWLPIGAQYRIFAIKKS